MRLTGRFLALALPLWLAAESLALAEEPRARLESRDCWFESSRIEGVDCAVLFVPNRWDQPAAKDSSEFFRLPVARFRAEPAGEDLPPVFFLAGGPGASAVPLQDSWALAVRRDANRRYPGRDVVLFDQRGTGRSYPKLACPEALDPHVWGGLSESETDADHGFVRQREALSACLDEYRELGRDLGALTSRESAADVDALRAVLGYDQIVLQGESYGTRLALTVMKSFPDSVAAAILDSVMPPQAPGGHLSTEHFGAALGRLFEACADHGACGKAYPDLRAQLAKVLAQLYVEPIRVEIQNLTGSAPLFARVDDVALLEIIHSEMRHRPGLQTLPMAISGLAKGEHWRIRSHAENHFYGHERTLLAIGTGLSLECHEQFPLASLRAQRSGAAAQPYLLNWGTTLWQESPCQIWPVEEIAEADSAAVESDIPTLLLAGAFDPASPLELAELAAATLANSHLFVIPNGAHGIIGDSDCAENIVVDFLAEPTTRPSPDCLQSLPQPAFIALGGG